MFGAVAGRRVQTVATTPATSTATHIGTPAHGAACIHSQVHPTYAQKSWGAHTRCDLALPSTSFGTVALRERQHLAMAGSRHLRDPLHATAHCAARAIYHVPHCCSVLAEVNARNCRLLTTGTVTQCGLVPAAWIRRQCFLDTSAQPGCTVVGPVVLSNVPDFLPQTRVSCRGSHRLLNPRRDRKRPQCDLVKRANENCNGSCRRALHISWT